MKRLPLFALALFIAGTAGCVEQPEAFPEGQAPVAANNTTETDGAGAVAGSKNDKYGWTLPVGATAYPLTEENYDKTMKADLEGELDAETILPILGTPSMTKNLERGKKEYTWYYTNTDGMVVKYFELTTMSGGGMTVSGEDERFIDPEWAKKYYDEDEEDETEDE